MFPGILALMYQETPLFCTHSLTPTYRPTESDDDDDGWESAEKPPTRLLHCKDSPLLFASRVMAARAPVNTMYVTHHYRPTGLNQPRGGSEIGQNLRSVPSLRVPSVVVVVHSVSIGVLLSIVSCSRALLPGRVKNRLSLYSLYLLCVFHSETKGAARDRSCRVFRIEVLCLA